MKYADKVSLVQKLNGEFGATPHYILASFNGLTVNQSNDLRGKIRAAGGSYRVIKNRLAKRAAAGTPMEALQDQFSGPCALLGHATDAIVLAKTISEYTKNNPQVSVVAGLVDARDVIDGPGAKQLASLPGLPELRAQLLALFLTPATSLVRLLNTPGGQLARVIDAHRDKQQGA